MNDDLRSCDSILEWLKNQMESRKPEAIRLAKLSARIKSDELRSNL